MRIFEQMKAALEAQTPLTDDGVAESQGTSTVHTIQMAFDLNSGGNPTTPALRATLYEVGAMAEIKSPLFGAFQAEVLQDNGAVLWVWHPFIEREVAIPNEWVIREDEPR